MGKGTEESEDGKRKGKKKKKKKKKELVSPWSRLIMIV
jgi:hypothetical protein